MSTLVEVKTKDELQVRRTFGLNYATWEGEWAPLTTPLGQGGKQLFEWAMQIWKIYLDLGLVKRGEEEEVADPRAVEPAAEFPGQPKEFNIYKLTCYSSTDFKKSACVLLY